MDCYGGAVGDALGSCCLCCVCGSLFLCTQTCTGPVGALAETKECCWHGRHGVVHHQQLGILPTAELPPCSSTCRLRRPCRYEHGPCEAPVQCQTALLQLSIAPSNTKCRPKQHGPKCRWKRWSHHIS